MPWLSRRSHPNFERFPHAKAGVSCTNCHSDDSFKAEASLLKVSQPHTLLPVPRRREGDVRDEFHHPVNEGAVTCSDCHDVHGTFKANNLKSTVDENLICTKCHVETRGPFVYEHAAVKGEGMHGVPYSAWFSERSAAEHAAVSICCAISATARWPPARFTVWVLDRRN